MNRLKKIFTIILFSALAQPLVHAQYITTPAPGRGFSIDESNPKMSEIDSIVIRIHYNATMLIDTTSAETGKEQMILDIGKKYVRYYSSLYNKLFNIMEKNSAMDALMTISYLKDNKTWCTSLYESYYLNMPEGKFTATGRIGTMDFRYEDDLPKIKWIIEDSVTTVCGYPAQKATCHYLGRDYIVWFTSEIPLPYGPWLLGGLPGLILSAKDTEGHYSFTFEDMGSSKSAMLYPEYHYIKTTKDKYLKMKSQIEADFPYYFNNYNNSSMRFGSYEGHKPLKLGNDFLERIK